MIVVYVAGPFRAPTAWGVAENVRAAERVGLELSRLGVMPLIPHANTAHFDGEGDGQFWVDGTLELLRRSDGAVFIDGWRGSVGSVGEHYECRRLDLPWVGIDGLTTMARQLALASLVSALHEKRSGK